MNFLNIKNQIKKFETGLDILNYCLEISNDNDIFLEFGVYAGNTINTISNFKKNNIIHGFDSFEGLPEDWRTNQNDPLKYFKGAFNLGGNLPNVNHNVKLWKGWFSETIPEFCKTLNTDSCISFLHVDCDLYSSTKCIFDHLGGYIKKNTIILFDEFYGYLEWEKHEYKAWLEFIESNKNIKYEYIGINIKHEQVAVRILDV